MNRLKDLEIYKERKNPNLLNEKLGKNKKYEIIIEQFFKQPQILDESDARTQINTYIHK